MATNAIISRVITYVPLKALLLGGADFTRKLRFGNGWSRIRIGILAAARPDSTNNMFNTSFYIGLCSSAGGGPVGSYSTGNFVGVSIVGQPNTVVRTMTYNSGSGYPYYTLTSGCVFQKSDQSQYYVQNAFGSAATVVPAYTGGRYRRWPYIVEIKRDPQGTGGVYTISGWCPTSGIAASYECDYSPAELLSVRGIDSTTTPTPGGQTMVNFANALTLNVAEQFGSFDTLNIYWGNSTFPLEIYAVAVNVIQENPYSDNFGGADESFESIALNTQIEDGSLTNTRYGWNGGDNVTYGPYNPGPVNAGGLFGTVGYPYDGFETYASGTADAYTTITGGTGWYGNGIIVNGDGTLDVPNGTGAVTGTTFAWPSDDFSSYSVGTVFVTATLNGGTNWTGNGTVFENYNIGTYQAVTSNDSFIWRTFTMSNYSG